MSTAKKQFLRNTASGWLAQLSGAAVGFFLLPYNIQHLGESAYGISVLVVSVLAVLNFLSFGMAPSLLRFFSQGVANNDKEYLRTLLSTAIVLLGGLGLLGFIIVLIFSSTFIEYYSITDQMAPSTFVLLVCMGFSFFLTFLTMVYHSFLLGENRYDLVNFLTIASQLLRLIVLVVLYNMFEPSLTLLGAALLIGSSFTLLSMAGLSFRISGTTSIFSTSYIKWDVLPSLFSFSFLTFINSVFFAASIQIPIMIIGKTLGVEMVTGFAPAVTVSTYLASTLSQLSSPLVPLASRDSVQNEGQNLGRWAVLLGQIVACAGYLCILILSVYGQEILVLWLGDEMTWTYWPVLILASGVVFASIQAVNYSLALGASTIAPVAYSSVVMAVLAIVGTYFGTLWWGWELVGVAICLSSIRFIRNGFFLPYVFSKIFNYDFFKYFMRIYLRPAFLLMVLIGLGLFIKEDFLSDGVMSILFCCVFLPILYVSGYWLFVFDKETKFIIIKTFNKKSLKV
ncbi:MAG: lipopolysaccharide biosynthesis protein [Desulfuromonadales bacterium]|nr:lipopolysaccharide biosynthesis protein [Desulfuromonadales bacterium]